MTRCSPEEQLDEPQRCVLAMLVATARRLLPGTVHVAGAPLGNGPPDGRRFPEEAAAIAHAAPSRQLEFLLGRACAREAMASAGIPAAPIRVGPGGEPLWPSGVVGTITHSGDVCLAAVARSSEITSLGIDVEDAKPLPEGVLGTIASKEEMRWFGGDAAEAGALIFSAKEAIYKAWFPLTGSWLDFREVRLEADLDRGSFHGQLLRDRLPCVFRDGLNGRFAMVAGLVLTTVTVPPLAFLHRSDPDLSGPMRAR